ncbi:PadR family transcriptional regulator [Radiobacillus sp. PE A8.2]|uniref:PadR family transcriptional regulator n=1 Tax=Radiobacillus sp. PE A8.2 TaxID=3380349 RepID=UPI00388D4366
MSIRLYILGILAISNDHPYQIKKKLVRALPNSQFSEGKFYYNFEALQKKGHIEAVEVVQEGKRPDKTLYAITTDGRKALEQGIYDSFKNTVILRELYISIYLLQFVDRQKVATILEDTITKEKQRLQQVKERNQNNEKFLEGYVKLNEQTKQSLDFIYDHSFNNADFNISWLEKLLEFVKK